MQITQKKISDTKVQLTLAADKEQLDSTKQKVLKAIAKGLKVPGFRQGKVPANLVEKHANPATVQGDFLDEILNVLYSTAVKEKGLRPVAQPEVSLKKFVPFTDLEVELTVDVIGDIKLADYRKMRIPRKHVTVSAKDVDEVVDQLLSRDAQKNEVKRASKDGDQVTMDFKGVDHKTQKAIPNTEGKDYPIVIGSKTFIPGFEPELIGLKAGESKTFTVTFPKDYGAKELQNKKVDFTVDIKKVESVDSPKLDAEFAAKVGPFKTVEDMKSDIKKQLQTEKDNQSMREYADEVLMKITKDTKMAVPARLVDEQIEQMIQEQRQNLMYRGQTWEEFLKAESKTEDEYKQSLRADAEIRVKAGFVLTEISDKEDVTVTPEEVDARLQLMRAQYADARMQAELDKPEARRDIAGRILSEKTADLLIGYASAKS